jgi:hypothetical protein
MADPNDDGPKIIHSQGPKLGEGFGESTPEPTPQPTDEAGQKSSKIRTFEKKRDVKEWRREPLTPGTGATHVRTFHSKLTEDALRYLDDVVNEWLDESGYEVKFVNTTIGQFTGKTKEPHLICSVWV